MNGISAPHPMALHEGESLAEDVAVEIVQHDGGGDHPRLRHRVLSASAAHPMEWELLHHLNARVQFDLAPSRSLEDFETRILLRRRPTDCKDRHV